MLGFTVLLLSEFVHGRPQLTLLASRRSLGFFPGLGSARQLLVPLLLDRLCALGVAALVRPAAQTQDNSDSHQSDSGADVQERGNRNHEAPRHMRYSDWRRLVRPRSVSPWNLSQRRISAQAPG